MWRQSLHFIPLTALSLGPRAGPAAGEGGPQRDGVRVSGGVHRLHDAGDRGQGHGGAGRRLLQDPRRRQGQCQTPRFDWLSHSVRYPSLSVAVHHARRDKAGAGRGAGAVLPLAHAALHRRRGARGRPGLLGLRLRPLRLFRPLGPFYDSSE